MSSQINPYFEDMKLPALQKVESFTQTEEKLGIPNVLDPTCFGQVSHMPYSDRKRDSFSIQKSTFHSNKDGDTKSRKSQKSKKSQAKSSKSKAAAKGNEVSKDFRKMFGNNIDEEKLQRYFGIFLDMVKQGKIEQMDQQEAAQTPSYAKLKRDIEKSHPVDPQSKIKFSLSSRVTVKDFDEKLADFLYFYFIKKKCRQCYRYCKKKLKGEPLQRFERPESLKDLPESSSSSSDSGDDNGDVQGLTTCFTKIGYGAALYLQTMKTLMILFFILTFLNIPIFAMYASNTEHNNYWNVYSSTFKLFTVGNLGQTNLRCGYTTLNTHLDFTSEKKAAPAKLECPSNTYISKIKNLGFLYIEDKRTSTKSKGEIFCNEINSPGEPVDQSLLEKIPESYLQEELNPEENSEEEIEEEMSEEEQSEEKEVPEEVVSYPLPPIVQGMIGQGSYQFCSSSCLDNNYTYCFREYEGKRSEKCFMSEPRTRFISFSKQLSYESQVEDSREYFCYSKEDMPESLSYVGCPNHPVCGKQTIQQIHPNYSYLKLFGFNNTVQTSFQSQIAASTNPNQCFFWVQPAHQTKQDSLLWLEFGYLSPDADVEVEFYFVDKNNSLQSVESAGFTPFVDQAVSVNRSKSLIASIKWGDEVDEYTQKVHLHSWVATSLESQEFNYYTEEMLQYNKTDYNLDTQCREDKLFTGDTAISLFNSYFDKMCMNKQSCEIDLEDNSLKFDLLISDECNYRIHDLGITSNDLLLIVGCKQDWITILPFTNITVHKQDAGVMIVIIEILCLLIMVHFFQKLKTINEEYVNILDDLTTQMKDFGVMFKDVQLDKYTQDPSILRMKLWLHLHDVMKPRRTRDNKLEILDITFGLFDEPHLHVLFRMQEIQQQIKQLNQKIFKESNDGEIDKMKSQIEKLELKMKRLRDRYKQLITRGAEFKKEEIRYKPKSQRNNYVPFIFVIFKHCLTSDLALEFLGKEQTLKSWLKYNLKQNSEQSSVLDAQKFCGSILDIHSIVDPGDILWQNFVFTKEEQYLRKIIVILLAALFVILNYVFYVYLAAMVKYIMVAIPNHNCPNQAFTKEDAYKDQLRDVSNGLMECYCSQEVSVLTFWRLVTTSFYEFDFNDGRRYCLEIFLKWLAKTTVFVGVSVIVVIVNEIISKIFLYLGQYTKLYTKQEVQKSSFNQILAMEFINMGMVALVHGFDFAGINKILLGDSPVVQNELYKGFTPDWYMDVGQFISFSLFVSTFVVNLKEFSIFSIRAFQRFRDRGYKFSIKKNPDDEDDDTPNTKLKLQHELVQLYTGKEFEGEKAFSRMSSTLFVILMYSSGMPAMYMIGAFFFTLTFFISKLLIIKFYRTQTTLANIIPQLAIKYLKYAIIIHILTGCLMLTNPAPFESKETPDQESWLSFLNPGVDPLEEVKNLEEQSLGQSSLSSSELVVGLFDRVKYFHQQLYILFLMVFAFLYLIWRSLYNLLQWLLTILLSVSVKTIMSIVVCVHRLFKRIKCKIQGTMYIDTEESVLFTPSDEEDDEQREEVSSSSCDEEEKAETKRDQKIQNKIMQHKESLKELQTRKSSMNLGNLGRRSINKKMEEDINNQIQQIENALLRKELQKKLRERKREQKIAKRKELKAIIRQMRMQRADYSENCLLEFSIKALDQFYQRAKKELLDFWDIFHLYEEFPDDMISPNSKSHLRVHFLEICFINRITTDQILQYQRLLQRRIRDIEGIIDKHFELIKEDVVQDVRNIYENERKRYKKDGIELSIQQQIELEQEEANALKHHPDVQFDNPSIYPYTKKLKKLLLHEEDLVKNDINRMENRRGIPEILRMDRTYTQSYFIFDSPDYVIARDLYFSMIPEHKVEDDKFINDILKEKQDKQEKKEATKSARSSKQSSGSVSDS